MKNPLKFVILMLLSIMLISTGCTANQGETPSSVEEDVKGQEDKVMSYDDMYISIGGGSLGGVWYTIAGGVAELINKNLPGSVATAQATGAAVENLRLLGSREIQIGMSDTITDFNAWNGTGAFDKPIRNFCLLGPAIQPTFQMVVTDEKITSWDDLNGKRIAIGTAGSSTLIASEQVFPIMGVDTYTSEVIGYEPGAIALKEGKVDAVWQLGAIPFPTITELATTLGVHLLEFPLEDARRIIDQYPYYSVTTIPAGTYTGQNEDLSSLCFQASFYVDSEMDADTVYEITKALYEEELEYLTNVCANMGYIDNEFLLEWASGICSSSILGTALL